MYPPLPRIPRRIRCATGILLSFALVGMIAAGCGDRSGEPAVEPASVGGVLGSGDLDPAGRTFTLQTGTTAPEGTTYVPVRLVGRNLQVLADSSQVSLEVAIHNSSAEVLYAPGLVALSRFLPADVTPLDADAVIAPMSPTGEVEYRYDYAAEFGEDGVLLPDETSGFRTWTFLAPQMGPFSFAARAGFGLEPAPARIAGRAFFDNNLNAVFDRGDTPMMMGIVRVTDPSGEVTEHWFEDEGGRYAVPIGESGLYSLRLEPLIDWFAPWYFTTPDPLNVLITPDADGRPRSFLGADFGLTYGPEPLPQLIGFTDAPIDSLHRAPWTLIGAGLERATVLRLHVGFSGCGPEQPTSLWMSGGFLEADPVQANVVFVNESLDECDAWFENDFDFNLVPLLGRFLDAYGPGVLQVNLIDYEGQTHILRIPVYPED